MNAPRFAAKDDYAVQLMKALVVDGAILDARLVIRYATEGFVRRFGAAGPVGTPFAACFSDGDAGRRLALMLRSVVASGGATVGWDTTTGFVEVDLDRPALSARISAFVGPGGGFLGYLVQEIPHPVTDDPAANVRRVAPRERDAARKILARLSHGYWEVDIDRSTHVTSETWRTMRGLPANVHFDYSPDVWRERVHPEDRQALFAHARDLYDGTADFRPSIYRERHADGHWITILTHGAVIETGADGKPRRIAGTDVDISASHSTEGYTREMAQLEQRWLIASEYGKLGLWDNDSVRGSRYVSQTWRQMRGYGPGDAFDESREALGERTHPDDRESLRLQIEETVNGGIDTVFQEYRERHRDGHYISILSRGRVIARDHRGVATRIIGIDADITEIKAASEEIERMSRRLEVAIEASRVGIWEVDLTNGRTVWDARMMELYGIDAAPGIIPPMAWENAIHPDDFDRVMVEADAVARDDAAFAAQYRVLLPDGGVRHIRAVSTQIFTDGGGKGLVGVDWDVTADVEAAEELRRAHELARRRNDELEQARAEMEHRALHDALTDLPNRRYLDQEMRRARPDGRDIAVMQLDLDRFKQINDTLGHAAGDAVLRHVAGVVGALVPAAALVARVGGDEFVVFFDIAPPREVLVGLADRIIARLSVPFDIDGQGCRFGASVGIATGRVPRHTPDEVLANADMALYEAKGAGRGHFVVFSERMRTAAQNKRVLADAILGGLDRGEFRCVYQPQFAAGTLQISGVEALVRWYRADGSVMAPGGFLGVAEELNVVDRLDQAVLGHVLADQAAWAAAGVAVPRVSVNVSARRLEDPALPHLLGNLGILPGRIAFELLETVFLDTPNPIITANIAAIRAMGIEIEIDDFGTGHASIVGMLRLQPDRLKIDQQLVGPLVEGDKQGILVRSIIDIGCMHGITVIAEGVETPDHVRLLTAMGCHHLQGYGLARPMPGDELCERMRTGRWDMTAAA